MKKNSQNQTVPAIPEGVSVAMAKIAETCTRAAVGGLQAMQAMMDAEVTGPGRAERPSRPAARRGCAMAANAAR